MPSLLNALTGVGKQANDEMVANDMLLGSGGCSLRLPDGGAQIFNPERGPCIVMPLTRY